MGNCPSCGKNQWRLKTIQCIICDKEGCSYCFVPLMDVVWGHSDSPSNYSSDLFVCNDKCQETFTSLVEDQITQSRIDLNDSEVPVYNYIDLAINANNFFIKYQVLEGIKEFPLRAPNWGEKYRFYNNLNQKCSTRLYLKEKLYRAKILMRVRRFEDAAQIYESYGMYEEAGKARAEDKQITNKKIEISVDLNSLLKQIKDGGLIIIYRCPHCNAPIKITKDTKLESLKICKHCNSAYEQIDIADILKTALS